MNKKEARLLINALDWVRAALDCKSFDWDDDQRRCAELELQDARIVIARYQDIGKLPGAKS